MKIQVTQDHIDRGQRQRSKYCPLALAVVDAGLGQHASVGMCILTWNGEDQDYQEFDLPFPAMVFMGRFDHGDAVEPFAFDIEPIVEEAEAL